MFHFGHPNPGILNQINPGGKRNLAPDSNPPSSYDSESKQVSFLLKNQSFTNKKMVLNYYFHIITFYIFVFHESGNFCRWNGYQAS